MTTLYELLDALPSDDADEIRAAFRKAAKATHPDTNPDDPDAPLKFRQLVRAHEILGDAEQRAAYDQLLTAALLESRSRQTRTAIYERIQKVASSTIAATVISAILIGGYTLFGRLSETPAIAERAVGAAATVLAELVAMPPPAQTEVPAAAARTDAIVPEEAGTRAEAVAPAEIITVSAPWPADGAEPIRNIELLADFRANDARSYRARGMAAYRSGDLFRALADFDLAIQHDPRSAEAYLDRGIVLYRMRNFDRAYADMAHAKRIGSTSHAKVPLPVPAPRRLTPPMQSRNAFTVAASDRFIDAPAQAQPWRR
ncbi:DnaJ domain-containing protein [Bradyrhizobium sp. NP1]|uniref:DnaJ domain-containing protein n=1 Tax=Bradyrhizobium sp. NP1 TaxID=3049772 RepID=UPI0025A64C6F|nr:DnaJ domain-containing protein [Bradyrhizobium sp. NP1]WJR76292.1 DnaJ domain-containing protein [Bradyrhizobium sp. NP1]